MMKVSVNLSSGQRLVLQSALLFIHDRNPRTNGSSNPLNKTIRVFEIVNGMDNFI